MAADSLDAGAGCLVGQGLGDALGFLVEGHAPEVCRVFVYEAFSLPDLPTHTRGPFAFGQYSDDTQLARELALSLVRHGGWKPDDFASRVAVLFRDNLIVGRGRATQAAASRLLKGIGWDKAGTPSPNAGNGAAMRAAPVGLFLPDDDERLVVADEQARVTHLDPRSRAAAVLVADVVAVNVARREEGLAWFADRVKDLDPVLAKHLVKDMPRWLKMENPDDAIARAGYTPKGAAHKFEQWRGISPFATPSVLYALYAFLKTPDDAEAVLHRAVSVGGDVDTVAAMAGAMVGAAVGTDGLGSRLLRWAALLNDRGNYDGEYLANLGASCQTQSSRAHNLPSGARTSTSLEATKGET
jgi:ADP-ribosylglycohydrolase